SRSILQRLGPRGRLIAIDKDAAAVEAARSLHDARVSVAHSSFARLGEVLRTVHAAPVDGILLDLGVSSPQLEEAARGFSFSRDGPLDMRMDQSRGETASEWLARASEREIREVITNYGEERFAKQIAAAIVAARARRPVATTQQLAEIVAAAVRTREHGQAP